MCKEQTGANSTPLHCNNPIFKVLPGAGNAGLEPQKPMKFLLEDYLKEKFPASKGQRGYFSDGTLI